MADLPLIAGAEPPYTALVTGASRGIGLATVDALLARDDVARVFAVARGAERSDALAERDPRRVVRIGADLTTPDGLRAIAAQVLPQCDALSLVFNAAGLLHAPGLVPEKSLASLDADALSRVFALNAFAPILMAQALLPRLSRGAPCVFASLSARVGSIGDNRLGGWYAYRASKAAQNQLLRTLSIELRRTHPRAVVLLLHPGTVDTDLSGPFQANVPADRLFTPQRAAAQLLDIVQRATPAHSGRFYAWDGSEIPW